MAMKKLLLITFPVDLGNATYEKRFISLFKEKADIDLKVFRFNSNQSKSHPKSIFTIDYLLIFLARLRESMKLWQAIYQAKKEERAILFHGVSTALFGYLATGKNQSYIVTEWTRKLYEPIWKTSGSPNWLTWIHTKILNAQISVLGLTDNVIDQIKKDYHVPSTKLKKVKLPFAYDLELFVSSQEFRNNEIRLLFVGGDFQRKGGDILLDWFKKYNEPGLKMTMVTNYLVEPCPGVTIETNVQYGNSKHVELFKNQDIFVLPTNCDSYPSVLGEAACAGLAILTTKNALGASEVIENGRNGYICDSQAELLERLIMLTKDKALISSMKQNSRKLMENKFSQERVLKEYLLYIFD
ncbi:MAG: glycosyltransferase family 4 protein [Pleurocapsa minor HA4230-MV1]|jgi:glycosyltransferase involved in cell wall biosynthesis|nr:glycosyltransferase family 4 protein [Pleurocapsa minor HA4230-MV1]